MIKMKMMAVLMVSLMMAVSVVPILGEDDEVSAAVGDGGYYSYTLTYHADQMANTAAQELQLTVDGMTPISHNSGVTTLSSLANEGSWTWNTTTGVGPFNSFYGAFDMTDGNKFVSVLNPYDLTKKIDRTALDDMTKYNIMWVLPTVYWYTDNDGNLVLTNDPDAGGIAYAHTINGKIREYLAYGVYMAGYKMVGDQYVITSESGVNAKRTMYAFDFDNYAKHYTMDDSLASSSGVAANVMITNFYQWELYKYIGLTIMEGFNSQAIVGAGMCNYSSLSTATSGTLDTYGPYAGLPVSSTSTSISTDNGQSPVKLLIENSWGAFQQWIGGTAYANDTLYVSQTDVARFNVDTAEVLAVETTTGGFQTDIYTDDKVWGFGKSGSVYGKGLSDYLQKQTATTIPNIPFVRYAGQYNAGIGAGINALDFTSSWSNEYTTARLMFAYGEVLNATVTVEDDSTNYGTISTPSTFSLMLNDELTISGNTITDGITTVTATPNEMTVANTYSFDGWYNGSTLIPDGTLTITGDMTITAHFSQALRNYEVQVGSVNIDYGIVSPTSLQIPYGTTVSSSNNTLIFGTTPDATVVTATPTTSDAQYTYAFSSWNSVPVGGTVTEDLAITANFTQTLNSYTITWVIGETSTTETYDYGEMPTHENPTPPEGYYFAGWNPEIATVTGDQTYTALFSNMTVTFDPGNGKLDGDASKVVVIGQPIGELPECTPPTNYTFEGWQTADGTEVTADTIVTEEASFTLYAHYELVPALQPVKAIFDILPILIAIGLILGAVYTFISRPELATTNNLLYAIVGISVAILVLSFIVLPIIGNAL